MSDSVTPAVIPKRAVALDFDGVIHRYSRGWHTKDIYDPPMPGAFEAIEELLERWHVFILTARPAREVFDWCVRQAPHLRFSMVPEGTVWWAPATPIVGVTNVKLPATAYIDDRGIRFTNWQDILNYLR